MRRTAAGHFVQLLDTNWKVWNVDAPFMYHPIFTVHKESTPSKGCGSNTVRIMYSRKNRLLVQQPWGEERRGCSGKTCVEVGMKMTISPSVIAMTEVEFFCGQKVENDKVVVNLYVEKYGSVQQRT